MNWRARSGVKRVELQIAMGTITLGLKKIMKEKRCKLQATSLTANMGCYKISYERK